MITADNAYADAEYIVEPPSIVSVFEERYDNKREAADIERLAKIKIKVIRGHQDRINSANFCCNDTRIITASKDGTVRIWKCDGGDELVKYENLHAPGANITKCCITRDNNRLISSGWDRRVRLTDAETGMFLWTGEHRGMVTDCNLSSDGKLVVTSSDIDHSIKLWDTVSGKMVKEITDLHTSTITTCTFDIKDARIISTSMDKTCKFWDMKSGVNTVTLSAHENIISDMSSTENGQLVATCGWDKMIYLWDITTGMYRSQGPTALHKLHEGCISAVSFSKDGSLLVSGSYDKNVIIWDTTEQNMKLKLQGHEDWVTDVSFSDNGQWVMSASSDCTIRLWNIAESDKIPMVNENKKTIGLRVSTCTNCKKPFSVAMLDDSSSPGHTLCVFCRMESRPTIWSVIDNILNSDNFDEDGENFTATEEPSHYDDKSGAVIEGTINDNTTNKK